MSVLLYFIFASFLAISVTHPPSSSAVPFVAIQGMGVAGMSDTAKNIQVLDLHKLGSNRGRNLSGKWSRKLQKIDAGGASCAVEISL